LTVVLLWQMKGAITTQTPFTSTRHIIPVDYNDTTSNNFSNKY
jgi:hypothetical protein